MELLICFLSCVENLSCFIHIFEFSQNNDIRPIYHLCNVFSLHSLNISAELLQVALRWIYQQGATFVVKSFNKERMTANTDIFDWELSKEELDKISQIPQGRGCSGEGFLSPNGPFKTLEELWDGEI